MEINCTFIHKKLLCDFSNGITIFRLQTIQLGNRLWLCESFLSEEDRVSSVLLLIVMSVFLLRFTWGMVSLRIKTIQSILAYAKQCACFRNRNVLFGLWYFLTPLRPIFAILCSSSFLASFPCNFGTFGRAIPRLYCFG